MWMLLLLLLLFIDEPIATDPPASMTYRASFRMDAIRHSNVRRLWRFVWWWKTTTSWGQKGPYRSTNHDRVQASQLSASVWASYKTDASRFLSLNKKKNKKEEKIAKTTLEGRRKRGKFFFFDWMIGRNRWRLEGGRCRRAGLRRRWRRPTGSAVGCCSWRWRPAWPTSTTTTVRHRYPKKGPPRLAVAFFLLPSFTGFYLVFFSIFTKFYWVLPGFTGFYLVLLGFTQFYPVLPWFTGFYLLLPSFTGFYWVWPSFTEFYLVLLSFT